MSESVAEMFGLLGIKTDFESVAKAQSALNKVKQAANEATATAKLSAALFKAHGRDAAAVAKSMGLAYDNSAEMKEHIAGQERSAKAAALIGLNYDKAGIKAAQATSRAERWGKALVVLNQGLELGLKLYRGVEAGIRAVSHAVQATADQASQAVDTGQRLGISASAVQELGYAAQKSAGDVEGMTLAMTGLSNKLDAAKKGGKDAAASLRAVGLDKNAGSQPLDVTLGKIADRFAAMPDGAKKSALAMDLFGKAGSKMIPLLNQGSAGIAALREEAKNTGYVIDNEASAKLEAFGDDTDKLKYTLLGLRNQAIAGLLPLISRMVNGLQGWIQANRELLVGSLTGALRVFLGVLEVVGDVVQGVVAVFGFLADHTDFVIAALSGVAAVLGLLAASWIAESAAAIAAAVASAIVWVALLWPILAIVAGVGLLVYAFLKFRKHVVGVAHAIRDAFVAIPRGIREAVEAVIDWAIGALEAVWNFAEKVAHRVKRIVLDTPFGFAKNAVKGAIGSVGKVLGADLGTAVPALASVPTTAGAGGAAASTFNQTNHTVINAQGMDETKLAKALADQAADQARAMKKAKGK